MSPNDKWVHLLDYWREDTLNFLHHDVPKIVGVFIIAAIILLLIRILRNRLVRHAERAAVAGIRAQQIRTLASVVYSVGVFLVAFFALMEILPLFNINIGPLLASAGVAGFAIGFGAQTLVKDFINGFFILIENTFDVGDVVRAAGVQGTVESLTLRRTMLRDADGTVHMVPNSQMTIISNLTRDWTQLTLHIAVDYKENSDRVVSLLKEVATEVRNDPNFSGSIVADPEVPGIDRVSGDTVDYLLLVKTRPGAQYGVARELRRKIKDCFEQQGIKPAGPNRFYVVSDATR
ncbi:MAG TPA: mechanosensitive ion channel family protein [Terriglobales bacterium]|nr:mechanosensitive ion channel family protein [Terriglobales bacterium]